jgi:hypothetical protein
MLETMLRKIRKKRNDTQVFFEAIFGGDIREREPEPNADTGTRKFFVCRTERSRVLAQPTARASRRDLESKEAQQIPG